MSDFQWWITSVYCISIFVSSVYLNRKKEEYNLLYEGVDPVMIGILSLLVPIWVLFWAPFYFIGKVGDLLTGDTQRFSEKEK